MSQYALTTFTSDQYTSAKAAWENFAGGADVFDVELAPFFCWVETHISPCDGDSVALQLVNKVADDRVDAIVEVVDSRRGVLSKLLKIVVSPQFWNVSDCRDQIIEIYKEIFTQFATSNTQVARQRKVKIYGRDDDMMSILRSLHSHWSVPNTSADFEGRFLAITFN